MQIQLTSEITWPYSTTSVISGLFYTSYSPVVSQDAAIPAVEYGLIFHGTCTGKYYCKNMKYRITRKMVPITGRASASFSSMLKLKHIGNE